MIADHRYQYLKHIYYFAEMVAYPVYYTANLPVHLWSKVYHNFTTRQQLIQENHKLRNSNLQLAIQLKNYRGLKLENEHLKKLLATSSKQDNTEILLAEVIDKRSSPFKKRIILNKGTNDKVYVKQAILGGEGVLGQVTSVTPFSATGLLITDPAHQMMAYIERLQIPVLLTGTGHPNQLELHKQQFDSQIRVGDTVVTTGLDDIYPANYPIGTVTEINVSPSSNLGRIIIKPSAQLTQGREVLLLWNH